MTSLRCFKYLAAFLISNPHISSKFLDSDIFSALAYRTNSSSASIFLHKADLPAPASP